MEYNDFDNITFTNVLKMHSSLLNSKVSKNIRNQGETFFCWAFATSTMLRQSLNSFISKLDEKLQNKTDALKKLNSIELHRQLRNELIMIPIPKNLESWYNQYSALNQGHYLNLAFERVNHSSEPIFVNLTLNFS